jgi:hypothetical protein
MRLKLHDQGDGVGTVGTFALYDGWHGWSNR